MKAVYQGIVIAESDDIVELENRHYFPLSSVKREYLRDSEHTSFCGWKGDCKYYHVEVDGQREKDAAWFYPEPYPAASKIRDHVAFWRGVEVQP